MIRDIELRRGGSVRVTGGDAESVVLESALPSPPGSTLELVLAGAPLGVKVRSCRRDAASSPAVFRIEGRWVSLSRVQRELLLAGPEAERSPGATSASEPGSAPEHPEE